MKKPEMKYMFASERLKVKGLSPEEVADAYNDMIDALIQSTNEIRHLYNILDIDGEKTFTVKQNIKALKKAGCTE